MSGTTRTYPLSPEDMANVTTRIAKTEGFVPRIYFDTHKPPIPTIGYGGRDKAVAWPYVS